MEIRRFGIGHRRREGLPGARGVSGQGIHNDARGHIAELAFRPHALITPHSNPNTTWFVVIEGGGFVQVGEERARVAAGEAVLWPANVVHGAWTELTPMRALVVEFSGEGADGGLLIEGSAVSVREPEGPAAEGRAMQVTDVAIGRAPGGLAPRPAVPLSEHRSPDEEPW